MRVAESARNCIVYLYASREEAERGVRAAATGFLIYIATPLDAADAGGVTGLSYTHVYLVTNDHVVQRCGSSTFARLNRKDTELLEILPLDSDRWHSHPGGDDVAVCYLGCDPRLPAESHYLSSGRFVTKKHLVDGYVGLGDDCMMIGRFAPHPGTRRNIPVVRFGNISMLPEEGVTFTERAHTQEAFLVEMRSRGGFSGSPVFLMPQLTWHHDEAPVILSYDSETRDQTLGIVCGHFHDWTRIRARLKSTQEDVECEIEDNSGMAIVIPAWRIQELLETEELTRARAEAEEERRRASPGVR
jgi:hypothetical protein